MARSYCPPLACLALTLLGALGCVDLPPSGGTDNTSIYVYDNVRGEVLAWDNVDALFAPSTTRAPEPDRKISSGTVRNCAPLWGGLAADATTDCLYLVPATRGTVTRLKQARGLNGHDIKASQIDTFRLGTDNDRFKGGSFFGPASVNPATGVLYITESSKDRNLHRTWQIPAAATVADDSRIPVSTAIAQTGSDKGFSSVVGGKGAAFYGYFPYGDTVTDVHKNNPQDGPRIRSGTVPADGFPKRSGVIAGHPTLNPDASSIPAYGCLGFDSSHNVLYVSRQASKAADKAILVFGAGQFNGGFNQAPERTLDDSASSLRNLRFIFHANSKDWLAGMDWLPPFQAPPVAPGKKAASKGNHMLHLWKSPSTGGTATPVNLDPDIQVGGIAFAAH